MRVAGACVLGYLSIRTLVEGGSRTSASTGEDLAHHVLFFMMFSFKIVNPKTWVLASAVSATHAAQNEVSILPLVLLTIFVPVGCVIAWSAIGQMLGRFLRKPMIRKALSFAFALTFAALATLLVLMVKSISGLFRPIPTITKAAQAAALHSKNGH